MNKFKTGSLLAVSLLALVGCGNNQQSGWNANEQKLINDHIYGVDLPYISVPGGKLEWDEDAEALVLSSTSVISNSVFKQIANSFDESWEIDEAYPDYGMEYLYGSKDIETSEGERTVSVELVLIDDEETPVDTGNDGYFYFYAYDPYYYEWQADILSEYMEEFAPWSTQVIPACSATKYAFDLSYSYFGVIDIYCYVDSDPTTSYRAALTDAGFVYLGLDEYDYYSYDDASRSVNVSCLYIEDYGIFDIYVALSSYNIESLTLDKKSTKIAPGESRTLEPTILDSDGEDVTDQYNITWTLDEEASESITVSNKGVVSVSADAELTDTATVTATVRDLYGDDLTATCDISVLDASLLVNYERVTDASQLVSGKKYLIVYEGTTSCALNSSLTTDVVNNNIELEVSNDRIVDTEGDLIDAAIVISEMTGGYSLQGTSGKYIGCTKKSNSISYASTEILNTIEIQSDRAVIKSNDYFLSFNNSSTQKRFRYYSNENQQKISLFVEE